MKLTSKINISIETTINKAVEFKKVLLGLRLDETTTSLLEYTNLISHIFEFNEINFLHVAPFYNPGMNPYIGNPITGYPLEAIYSETDWQRGTEQIDTIKKELIETVDAIWNPSRNINMECIVREGAPLDELVSQAEEGSADLIIIGKSKDFNRHQITAKNIIRQTSANVLLVPENSPTTLERILVPFDYSPSSIQALKIAVAIKKSMLVPPIVQVINIYDTTDYSLFSLEPINNESALNPSEGLQNFMAEYFPEIRNEIHPISVKKDKKNIAQYLLEKCEEYQSDMIIMGSKGHSKLELLYLGSITERLLSNNYNIPTLIVK